jgi:hypothetical protein
MMIKQMDQPLEWLFFLNCLSTMSTLSYLYSIRILQPQRGDDGSGMQGLLRQTKKETAITALGMVVGWAAWSGERFSMSPRWFPTNIIAPAILIAYCAAVLISGGRFLKRGDARG